jgi:colanic acid biosynthesis glycosyl transferase WcaI
MKLLFYGINYAPELTGIGKFTGEMAAWFAKRGHSVRVISAPPYYPAWKVAEEYSSLKYCTELRNGVQVFRSPLFVPVQPTGIKRLLHLSSFAFFSIPLLVSQWNWKPDIVWMVEPTILCSPAVLFFSLLRGSKSWLHIQDFEIDAAFNLRLINSNIFKSYIKTIERWLMLRFDRISLISGNMIKVVINKGISHSKLVYFPNWVDISKITPLKFSSPYRTELGISDDAIVALYSGNMGNKQGLDVLAEVARKLKYQQQIKFVFGGNGSGRSDLERRCAGLTNVHFVDLQSQERLNDWLGLADIHLLPQRADAADLVMPSKLTGMMASGRPVLATADFDTELGRVVSHEAKCGIIVPPEQSDDMAQALLDLAANPAKRFELGANGRQYAERELCQNVILARFEAELQSLVLKQPK